MWIVYTVVVSGVKSIEVACAVPSMLFSVCVGHLLVVRSSVVCFKPIGM